MDGNGRISPGDGVTLGDGDYRKSLMKMIYRKLPKTASLPVTCHEDIHRSTFQPEIDAKAL
jgi:hypothetical protein